MGTLYLEPATLPKDLKVSIQDSCLVYPAETSERKSMFLGNIDQVLNFDVQTIHFFPPNEDFPPQIVAERLKKALAEALVVYEFFGGRLKMNSEKGRLEIDCNAAGVGFVVASSELRLEEIGDLVYPNPAFEQLVCKSLEFLQPHDRPLCILQVTSFKCGGFSMGFSVNHLTFDGLSFKMFLSNLGALAASKPLVMTPCNDRELLAARSPPQVKFPHLELVKLEIPIGGDASAAPSVFEATREDLDFKIFKLTSNDIEDLKEKAKSTIGDSTNVRVSGFNAIAALVWRCKALSFDCENNDERSSTMLYAVDIRSRLKPPLQESFAGNAVLTAYATAKCKELEENPFGKIVDMVAEGSRRMTDEYARSAIDWGELHKGFPNGEFLISSWWRLGFTEVEYPWGKPRYSCPLVYQRKDIILLFPDIKGEPGEEGGSKSEVNVLVALPKKEMEKFQALFLEFL